MIYGRSVPWASWREWAAVRDLLRSRAPEDFAKGLEMVSVWRCRGRVPLSVDIYATLKDIKSRVSSNAALGPNEEYQTRLQCAMLIVRLVNGITDAGQKGKMANSVAFVAGLAGLPRLLVDIRHESSHNALPSLPLLRLGLDEALVWLDAAYWDSQSKHLHTCFEKMATLLKDLVEVREEAVRTAFHRPDAFLEEEEEEEEEDDDDEMKDHDGPTPDGPLKIDTQQKKKILLLELKDLVNSSYVSLVADVILEHGILPMPKTKEEVEDARDDDLDAALLESVLTLLVSWMPDLQSAILTGAISRLIGTYKCCILPRDPPNNVDQERCMAWAKFWLHDRQDRLLKTGNELAATRWMPSEAQVRTLYSECMASQSRGDSVDAICQLLTKALPGNPSKRKFAVLTHGAPVSDKGKESQGAKDEPQSELSDVEKGALDEMDAQLALLEQLAQDKQRSDVFSERPRKWRRLSSWTPCAIGNLPSVHYCNGKPSILHRKTLSKA